MVGQTISHYKVLSEVGRGGMGVVYKAEDLKLKRQVALKFLRPDVLEDEEHRERFLREAQAAAALDHPNICTVHEIDEVEGETFIAMALLEGQTVKEKIAERPLKLEEALDIAIQTAQGLQAAHEKGIVHRDIKSANLMVTPQGTVKVMDFGLAQLADRSQLTKTQTMLGTPAYMSPEQARREPTARPTDLWSLGVVIYEMVTGKLPFAGERQEAVLYAIGNEEPEPITALRAGLPMDLEWIVSMALAKDLEDRYQRAEDILVDLRSLRKKLAAGKSTILRPANLGGSVVPKAPVPVPTSRVGWRERLAWGLVVVFLLTILYLATGPGEKPQGESIKAGLLGVPDATRNRAVAISPGGDRLAFVGDLEGRPHLWLREWDELESRVLSGTKDAAYPFWSPDGNWLAFFTQGELKRIPVTGGPPQTICDAREGRGGTWNSDGVILFVPDISTGIHRVSERGGEPVPVTTLDLARGDDSHRWPSFLPDGHHFLFFIRSSQKNRQGLYVGSLDTGERHRVLDVAGNGEYSEGWLLFAQEGALVAQTFNTDKLAIGQLRRVLAEAVRVDDNTHASLSVSPNKLVYCPPSMASLAWVGRDGERSGIVPFKNTFPKLSIGLDGETAAVGLLDPRSRESDVWTMDFSRETITRFTTHPAYDYRPVWSPDGKQIVFASNREGTMNLWVRDFPPTEPARSLQPSNNRQYPTDWSRDGRFVVYTELDPFSNRDLWALPLTEDAEPLLLRRTEFDERQGKVSPNGKWLAFTSNESGEEEVYVQGFPQGEGSQRVSTSGGSWPSWSSEGRELYFLASDRNLMAVDVQPGEALRLGRARALFRLSGRWYEPDPTSQRFLTLVRDTALSGSTINVVLNWTQMLTR